MEKIVAFEAYHTARFETMLAEFREEMAHNHWEEAIRALMDRILEMRGTARIAGRKTLATYRERTR